MNKFVHKTIAAVMIAGASTGVASTALMTTAHAANLADSTDLKYENNVLSGDVYKDVKYKIQGKVPAGTTFSKNGVAESFFNLDEKTGEITVLAGPPAAGTMGGSLVTVKYSDGSTENIELSIGGEATLVPSVPITNVEPGKDTEISAKPEEPLAFKFTHDEDVAYRIKEGTLPESIKDGFRIEHLSGFVEFTTPKDFTEPIVFEVEAFEGRGEENLKVVDTYKVVISPENSGSSQTDKDNTTEENTSDNSEETTNGDSTEKTTSPSEDTPKDSTNGDQVENSDSTDDATIDDNPSSDSDNTNSNSSTDNDNTDDNPSTDKKDIVDSEEGSDDTIRDNDDVEEEDTQERDTDKDSTSVEGAGKETTPDNVAHPEAPVQSNPSRVNTPPAVPFAPSQNVADAAYGPKVFTGGDVDNIWGKIANIFK